MSDRSVRALILSVCLMLLAASLFAASVGDRYRAGEIVVKFKPGIQAKSASAAMGASVRRSVPHIDAHCLKLKPGQSVEDAVAKFRKNPNVLWASPNYIVRLASTMPNDPWFAGEEFCIPELDICLPMGGQWGLYNTDGRHDIHAPEAWDIEKGSEDTIIAVVDTGIQDYHWDLAGRVLEGYNVLDGTTNADDDQGHGTFVASVAAANTDNNDGVAGVDWNASLLPVKVLDMNGEGDEVGCAEGIIWAADHGAKIINMSFGAHETAQVLEDAVNYAWNAGCIVIAASGNEDLDDAVTPTYPAYYPVCISVGATNEYDQRCSPMDWIEGGSNYGDSLDVMAPGNNIYGAVPGYYDEWTEEWTEYEAMTGTSAAAPFVAGLAGLVWAQNPSWTNQQVRDQIELTCDNLLTAGWDRYTGYGRINAYRALSEQLAVCATIGEARGKPQNADISLVAKVVTAGTDTLVDRFYIEEPDRSAGLMIYCGSSGSIQALVGEAVKIRGRLGYIDGEPAITSPRVIPDGTGDVPRPLGLSMHGITGTLDSYGGETPAVGLTNVGLLVRIWGKVKFAYGNFFYLDDGSALRDGEGMTGLKVYADSLHRPRVGDRLSVTGISSLEPSSDGLHLIPVVRTRAPSDILKLN